MTPELETALRDFIVAARLSARTAERASAVFNAEVKALRTEAEVVDEGLSITPERLPGLVAALGADPALVADLVVAGFQGGYVASRARAMDSVLRLLGSAFDKSWTRSYNAELARRVAEDIATQSEQTSQRQPVAGAAAPKEQTP